MGSMQDVLQDPRYAERVGVLITHGKTEEQAKSIAADDIRLIQAMEQTTMGDTVSGDKSHEFAGVKCPHCGATLGVRVELD